MRYRAKIINSQTNKEILRFIGKDFEEGGMVLEFEYTDEEREHIRRKIIDYLLQTGITNDFYYALSIANSFFLNEVLIEEAK